MAVLKMKIGLNIALSLCIQQHPIYLTLISVMLVCIHYIGVNLVKVARQYGMLIEKPLHILTIVLGVDNQCPVIDCQGNIRLQGRQHINGHRIVFGNIPLNLPCRGLTHRVMFFVIC